MPTTNFIASSTIIVKILLGWESITGIASSDVAINTARSVPIVICFLEYKSAITPEKPHCGICPSALATSGPVFLEVFKIFLCEKKATNRYTRYKIGSALSVSKKASSIASNIFSP